MDMMTGAGAAMAVAANAPGVCTPVVMRPQPIPAAALRTRRLTGEYPFLCHRTVAEVCAA